MTTNPLRSGRRASAMVYMLFIVIVLGVAAAGLIHAVANEMVAGATRQQRLRWQYAADAALVVARGRLKLQQGPPARQVWSPAEFASGGLLDTDFDSALSSGTIPVKVHLENIAGRPYSIANPTANVRAVAGPDLKEVVINQQVIEGNASGYAGWWGPYEQMSMALGFFPTLFPTKGKIVFFWGTKATFDDSRIVAPAGYQGPFYQGEVIFINNQEIGNVITDTLTTVSREQAFAGGISIYNQLNGPKIDQDVLRSAELLANSTGTVYTIDPDQTFQIRLHGNTYDWRVIPASTPGADFVDYSLTGWTGANIPVPLNSVILVKDSTGTDWINQGDVMFTSALGMPRTNVARHNSEYDTGSGDLYKVTGGVQVWAASDDWTPSRDKFDNAAGVAVDPRSTRFDQNAAFISGNFSIASEGNIEVMGSIRYSDTGIDGDMLGLIARNAVYFRNDQLADQDGSPSNPFTCADRIRYLHAFLMTQRGYVKSIYNWSTGAFNGLPDDQDPYTDDMALPCEGLGTRFESAMWSNANIKTPFVVADPAGGVQYESLTAGPGGFNWWCGFQEYYSEGLEFPDPGTWMHDERGVDRPPAGFPRVLNTPAERVRGTWNIE